MAERSEEPRSRRRGRLDPMAAVADEIAALRGTKRATLRDLITDPRFSRLWRAMLVSSTGDWVGFVAVAALVTRLAAGSLVGLAVAGVMLARLLPSVLFGPFAGAFADRYDRKKLMVWADLARGSLYAFVPFLPSLWLIFLVSFVIESLSLLWTPAKDASIPNLVPRRQLSNANSVGLITTYGTLPLGAIIYTTLAGVSEGIGSRVGYFHNHPEFLALWLDALTFFFSARMVWGLQLPPQRAAGAAVSDRPGLVAQDLLRDVRAGYRFLREHSMVRAMTLGIVIAFAGVGSVISLGPVFAALTVNAPSTGFGFLMTAFGVGMGGGMALMNFVTRFIEKDRLFPIAMLGSGVCLVFL
ncbi:MAG: MFS transporter, partial [Actinomycetota bacterium]